MPPVSAEVKAKILAEYKASLASGSKKTMAEIGRSFNVSRYVVKGVVAKINQPTTKATEKQATEKPKEVAEDDTDDDASSLASAASNDTNFFMRNAKFAEDLGLSEPSKAPFTEEKNGLKPAEVDEALDSMMGKVLNATASSTIPSIMPTTLSPGMPQGKLMEELMRDMPKGRRRYALPSDESPFSSKPQYDREDLTQKIIFNVHHFGPSLEAVLGPKETHQAFLKSLPTKEPPELKNLLTMLERTRSVSTIAGGFRQVFYGVAQGVEVVSSFVGVKSQGFVEQLNKQDEEITMILKEIALQEWQRLKELDSPQTRLGMLFCLSLAQTHTRNQIKEYSRQGSSQPLASPVSPEVAEANKDL